MRDGWRNLKNKKLKKKFKNMEESLGGHVDT